MRPMENLEYSRVVAGLQSLIGKHFSNIQLLGEGKYRLRIGNLDILTELGKRFHITKYLDEPLEADQFAKKIRKELDNARLVSVEQKNMDRIIVFGFEAGGKRAISLVFEMFAKGNAVLVAEGKTIAAYREEKWADREIKRGADYSFPKPNIASSVNEARKKSSGKYIIVCLMKLPLGKIYAKELLTRCEIDEKRPENELSEKEAGELESGFRKMMDTKDAFIFVNTGGGVIDYGVCPLAVYADATAESSKTISEAADEYYFKGVEPEAGEKRSERLQKLEKRLAEQEKALAEATTREKELKETGDFIYGNYEKIERILAEAKKTGIQNIWDTEQLKKTNARVVDQKKKEIEVEV